MIKTWSTRGRYGRKIHYTTILLKIMIVGFLIIISSVIASTVSSSIKTTTSSSSSYLKRTTSSIPPQRSCTGSAVVPSNRRACGLFLWDLPSAVLYKWCHHLLKDHIYEGRGGYLFVRYESNSILQLLYPCSRYSPNKCMICGGSAPDHLELWWSKQLYSPFDQYLDKTYNEALIIDDKDAMTIAAAINTDGTSRKRGSTNRLNNNNNNHNNRRVRNNKSRPSTTATTTIITGPPSFAFHKRYVEDVSDIVNEVKDRKEQVKLIMKKISTLRSDTNYRIKKIPLTGITYIVPGIGGRDNDKENYTKKEAFIDLLSMIALGSVDDVIFQQAIEFKHRKRKNSRLSNNRF